MPYNKAPLSAAQRDLILDWINQGAKNETCVPAGGCDSTNVTYAAVINPIIQSNCSGCHNANLASGGYNFSTHSGLAIPAQNGRLVGAVSHAPGYHPMPQGGKLNNCQIAQIKRWVALGALNN
jgi:mono/diheme cytochrome c family protein